MKISVNAVCLTVIAFHYILKISREMSVITIVLCLLAILKLPLKYSVKTMKLMSWEKVIKQEKLLVLASFKETNHRETRQIQY